MDFFLYICNLNKKDMGKKLVKEGELKIYDVFKSVNGNLFIKITHDYSIAIGSKGNHDPGFDEKLYVKIQNVSDVKKVGRIIFDKKKKKK